MFEWRMVRRHVFYSVLLRAAFGGGHSREHHEYINDHSKRVYYNDVSGKNRIVYCHSGYKYRDKPRRVARRHTFTRLPKSSTGHAPHTNVHAVDVELISCV